MASRKAQFWRGRNFAKMQLSTCRSLLKILSKKPQLLGAERADARRLGVDLEILWDEWDERSRTIKELNLLALSSLGRGARGRWS